mmetsp:Transcript_23790/g.33301  ORF Transcript_23790/g.33301 Transcript_23790/m.33301 type:complete len:86 (+) Transcript_23790:40-297(+)|eukprot:CAMPEP_0184488004 /NCGR_PEP_ID=MMETSP0113_2-20130426/10472_1 /TAXON_ID=91329 /ORGANISM="Norrisiella sphaerica, Strain BC52" /LENGTH=85 /DNA_ID=CAMNT_0026870465 /DNA_START=18 /DNA_END=275 /DNA_ORIENTATION=+
MPFGNDAWRKHELYRFSSKTAWPGFRIGVAAFIVAAGIETAYNLATSKGGHGHGGHGHDDHGHVEHHHHTSFETVLGEPPAMKED